jgi:hypothetical protein
MCWGGGWAIYREGRDALSQHYRHGRQVHWSGFSSASPSRKVALDFAGAGGVLLRLVLLPEDSRSRDIHRLSAISAEHEVFLHTVWYSQGTAQASYRRQSLDCCVLYHDAKY